MTTTSISVHHATCRNCPRFTWSRDVYLCSSRAVPVSSFLTLSLGESCKSWRWAVSPLFKSPRVPVLPPLRTCSQLYLTCSPSSPSSHIPLFAIPSNHTLLHIQENQCCNPTFFPLDLHRTGSFVCTLPSPVISCFQEKTELKDWPAYAFPSKCFATTERSIRDHMYRAITEYIATSLQANSRS